MDQDDSSNYDGSSKEEIISSGIPSVAHCI